MDEERGRLVPFRDRGQQWLVIRTKSHQERLAVDHLQERGVEPYCPLFLEPPWHPRAPRGPVPLFAGYIFAHCRPDRVGAIRYCPGVLHPVTFDRRLATVEQGVIDELRAREQERGYILPVEMEEGIRVGQRVRLMAGPLRGLEGVFHGYLRGGQRAQVLMSFLRSEYLVEVDTEALALARC
jgi:hypothetical protein